MAIHMPRCPSGATLSRRLAKVFAFTLIVPGASLLLVVHGTRATAAQKVFSREQPQYYASLFLQCCGRRQHYPASNAAYCQLESSFLI